MGFPTRFANHADLSRLPWFEQLPGERLVLDPAVGPAVDCHTHLAMSYGLPNRVDLLHEAPVTKHYVPFGAPVDLAPYMNTNIGPSDFKRMVLDLSLHSVVGGGMRRTHTIPNLLREMRDLGITHSVLLAIDQPLLSKNTETWLAAARGIPELITFGSVHPLAPFGSRRLAQQQQAGARGIKMHPAAQFLRPDHPKAIQLYQRCGARGMPVLWHCGPVGIEPKRAAERCQLIHYERPIAETPETTFLLGHSGALQMEQAVDLANRYPNVYLELASQGLERMRVIFDKGPRDRIINGSDWPFYHLATPVAKVLICTDGDEDLRRAVLYENAARLLGLPAWQDVQNTRERAAVAN